MSTLSRVVTVKYLIEFPDLNDEKLNQISEDEIVERLSSHHGAHRLILPGAYQRGKERELAHYSEKYELANNAKANVRLTSVGVE